MKKPSIVSFLITLLLAAAICTQGQEPVMDTDGNPVQLGDQYFIQPVNNNGGGLVPAAIKVLPFCPLGVTQTLLPNQPGLPISFYLGIAPANLAIQVPPVTTTYSFVISFRSKIWPVCNEFSTLWKVDDSSTAAKEPAILVGGNQQEQNSFFTVEKAGESAGANTYKLTTFAGTVGTIPGAWLDAPQLVVTNDTAKTLLVKFKKVEDTTTATTYTSRIEKLGLRMFPFY